MPELWLRRIFPKTVFVSTDLPEKRVRVTKTQNELDELDDESTDIYTSNIIERYSLRPKGIPAVLNYALQNLLHSILRTINQMMLRQKILNLTF